MGNQISYSAPTWHTSGKEKDWSDFKLCLFFVLSEHDMKGCFSIPLAEKTNGLSKRAISSTLMVNWRKKASKQEASRQEHQFPSLPIWPWTAFDWKHCTEMNDKWRREVMHKSSAGKEGNQHWTLTRSPCVLLLGYSGDGWEKAGRSHLLEEVA